MSFSTTASGENAGSKGGASIWDLGGQIEKINK